MSEDESRQLPTSDLDLQMMIINSEWGTAPKSEGLGVITQDYSVTYPAGTIIILSDGTTQQLTEPITINSKSALWGLLSYLTRDLRLGNLTGAEVDETRHLLDLAGDCLQEGYINSFSLCIKKTAHILELSQSRKGFLRKLINTLRREEYKSELEPKKSKFFGGGEK